MIDMLGMMNTTDMLGMMNATDMLDMIGMVGLSKALEFFDNLPSLGDMILRQMPFFLFVLAIILGNLWDKKKPRVQRPKPFPKNAPLPDIQRPAEVTVEVRPIPQPPVRQGRGPEGNGPAVQEPALAAACEYEDAPAGAGAGIVHAGRVMDVSLAQAVIAAEVLGKPRALRPRKR